jgi:nucleotide-binding universal stress UspA family protein
MAFILLVCLYWRKQMEEVKKILCPVDFSEFSNRAVRYAAAISRKFRSTLMLYHCIPSAMTTSGTPEGIPVTWENVESRIALEMEKLLSACKLYDIQISSIVETGDPPHRILEAARKEHADMIVMGTHGAGGYEAILMGSVTNKVLHRATVPVLAVCEVKKGVLSGDPDEPLWIGKILCAVDPSNIRVQMLSRAMSWARSNRSTIYFLAVGDSSETNRVVNDLREIIVPEKEDCCKVEFVQASGNATEEILKAIHSYDIDLVVMGHHSRTPMPLEALGSVTLRVIPRSNCAVLVVRD